MSYIENLESVGKKMIVEEKGLKITEDAILLSEFMKKYFSRKRKNLKGEKSFLEIGAGQGIISLLLSELDIISKIFAVEIQEEVFQSSKKVSISLIPVVNVSISRTSVFCSNSSLSSFFKSCCLFLDTFPII